MSIAEPGQSRFAFGPVPSRRLGRSLGINNIPPKSCSYSCVYCQVGRTTEMGCERRAFYPVADIVRDVQLAVEKARARDEAIDYLTFVPDGEPTLDANLGAEIEAFRARGHRVAVITNGSLIWHDDVRADLAKADWVSLKVDAVHENVWRKVNRPHGALRLSLLLEGMQAFAQSYRGLLATETMLVSGVNDTTEHMRDIADFLAQLRPSGVYLAIPTRPPAEPWVHPPDEETLNRCDQILSARLERVEYLIGYEGDAFAWTRDVQEDILRITAVHPMRQEAVQRLLERAGAPWSVVETLINRNKLVATQYQGQTFYMRRLRRDSHG
jgi:wyosine [tRNA(Phe)-imidazoG37] synthetase (radical SAM superfamily)